jgi:hypothetical protein
LENNSGFNKIIKKELVKLMEQVVIKYLKHLLGKSFLQVKWRAVKKQDSPKIADPTKAIVSSRLMKMHDKL